MIRAKESCQSRRGASGKVSCSEVRLCLFDLRLPSLLLRCYGGFGKQSTKKLLNIEEGKDAANEVPT